jgi:hypothetical protein
MGSGYFLLHVDFFFDKTSSNSGVPRSGVNNVKIPLEGGVDDDEEMDDADEVERVVTICCGAYCCGIGAASGVGGEEPGNEGGFCGYATVTCVEGTRRPYFDGDGGSGIIPLV